ncbi:hypothetical protein D1872_287980 [compost metagenome]
MFGDVHNDADHRGDGLRPFIQNGNIAARLDRRLFDRFHLLNGRIGEGIAGLGLRRSLPDLLRHHGG